MVARFQMISDMAISQQSSAPSPVFSNALRNAH
jgi:hypothetical protein